jgi:hypothetical protein
VNIDLKRYDLYLKYWFRKWRFFVIFFLIGLIITSSGVLLLYTYYNPQTFSTNPYYHGFGIARNDTAIPSIMTIGFVVDPAEFSFQYFFETMVNGTYNFIFVFPFHVRSIVGESENMSMSVNTTDTCTVISVNLNSTQFSSGKISGDFMIDQTFLSDNRGIYTIVLPFGNGIDNKIYGKIQNDLDVSLHVPDAPIDLYVSLPNAYSWTESFPSMVGMNPFINPFSNKSVTSLYWNFDKLQNSVTIKCDNQFEIGVYGYYLFISGIFLGVGIPLMMTAYYDSLKKFSEKAEKYGE